MVMNRYVCKNCFVDSSIKDYIECNGENIKCHYCESYTKGMLLYDAAEYLLGCISQEYDDGNDLCVGYCSQEGGWIGEEPMTSLDLINSLPIAYDVNLCNDLASMFPDLCWFSRDIYGQGEHNSYMDLWHNFSNQVKHRTRFMFFKVKADKSGHHYSNDGIEPNQILNALSGFIKNGELIKTLQTGTIVYRARANEDKNAIFTNVSDLSSPPNHKAANGRMAPSGISVFYCATSTETALEEIKDPEREDTTATVVNFELLKDLNYLDLTALSEPSLFGNQAHLREEYFFLKKFQQIISTPYHKSNLIEIDYIPTQILTEYIFQVMRYSRKKVCAIAYNSSRVRGGICYVFNAQQEHFIDTLNFDKNRKNKWFNMLPETLKLHQLLNSTLKNS